MTRMCSPKPCGTRGTCTRDPSRTGTSPRWSDSSEDELMKAQRKELKTDARLLTKAHPSSGRSLGLCATPHFWHNITTIYFLYLIVWFHLFFFWILYESKTQLKDGRKHFLIKSTPERVLLFCHKNSRAHLLSAAQKFLEFLQVLFQCRKLINVF